MPGFDSAPGELRAPSSRSPPRRFWIGGVIVIVAVVCLVAGVYEVERGADRSSNNSRVLIPAPQYEWLPQEQFNNVAFVVATSATVTGTFSDTNGLVVYLMTPDQLANLTRTGAVEGYAWSSGPVPSPVHYQLSVSSGAGDWNLVFYNPSATIPSGVNFWAPVVETTP